MKKLVIMSNKPWAHSSHLKNLCQMTGCKIQSFLCAEYTTHDGIFGDSKVFAPPEVYEKIGQMFDAEIIYNDANEFLKRAEQYINSTDVIIFAEIEYANDEIFKFLVRHKDAKNVICTAQYESSILLANDKLENFDITIPSGDDNRKLVYDSEDKGYQKLISIVKQ